MNFKITIGLLTTFFIVLAGGCKKSQVDETPPLAGLIVEANDLPLGTPQIINAGSAVHMPTGANSKDYSFDWELAQEMPRPQNDPVIVMPWADNASRQYDEHLRFDYKKSDGWELVYNTFTTNKQDARYFLLYNKFRGVLRCYVYYGLDMAYSSTLDALTHTLELRGNSNILNYADQHIINPDENSQLVSVSEPYPLVKNSWYMSQFELAYDPFLSKGAFPNFSIRWGIGFQDLFSGELNDKNIMNAKLSLQGQGTNASANGLKGEIQMNFKSLAVAGDLQNVFNMETLTGLERQMSGKEELTNIFNGLSISGTDIMNVKTTTKGLLNREHMAVNYSNVSFALPGYDNSNTIGISPIFNESPGIFYLDGKPKVFLKSITGTLNHEYTLDQSSVKYILNPFVSGYAEVENIRQQIVAKDMEDAKSLTEARIFKGQQLKSNELLSIIGVRVSFDVVPRNGSKKVRIVKTFSADVVN
jgi:hypothetical protein